MIHVYYGSGKGKTSAALGFLLKAAGDNKKVSLIQVLKSEPPLERALIDKMPSVFSYFFGTQNLKKIDTSSAEEKEKVSSALQFANHIIKEPKEDVIILDEILDALKLGLLNEPDLKSLVENTPADKDLVLTGESAPGWLIKKATYVTEIKNIKYPKL